MFIKRSINQYYNTEEADLFGSVPDHLWLIEIISPHAPCSVQVLCTSYKQSIHTQTERQHKTVFLFLLQFDFPLIYHRLSTAFLTRVYKPVFRIMF